MKQYSTLSAIRTLFDLYMHHDTPNAHRAIRYIEDMACIATPLEDLASDLDYENKAVSDAMRLVAEFLRDLEAHKGYAEDLEDEYIAAHPELYED